MSSFDDTQLRSAPYTARVDRDRPACLVFMLDQSTSMSDPLAGDATRSKHVALADILNGLLYEVVLRCVKSPQEGPRPYFAIAVVGYRTDGSGGPIVQSALQAPLNEHDVVWTPDLATNPLRIDKRPAPSGSGEVSAPVWIEPTANGGTPMCAAFDRAGLIARSWLDTYPDSFPPIVVNITDGEATDGDPLPWAQRLTSMRSSDGHVLLFNLGLSSEPTTPMLFPNSTAGLPDKHTKLMFDMSSELPPSMLDAARAQGFDVQPGARGFGCNADLRSVVTFLNVGTAVGRTLR